MENSKSGCAIFIDVENQADVKPCALIEFFEPYFAIEEKTACAEFSRPNMRRIERKLATANINMVRVAKPVRTERTGSDLADYTLIKRVWATYRERRNRISTFVIVSGDCGFIGTVIALKQLNKTVIVAADPNRIGPGLREEADRFIPLVDGEPAPGDQWIEGDSEKHEATSLALPLLSDDRMIQLLLTLEEENHYVTFRLVARRTLSGDRNKAAQRQLFDQLEAFVTNRVLLKYTHHDPVKNKDYAAVRLNRSHSLVQRVLSVERTKMPAAA